MPEHLTMDSELNLLSPPATPPLDLNKVNALDWRDMIIIFIQ